MKKKIITWPRVMLVLIIMWGLLHSTPHSSLRTRLFLDSRVINKHIYNCLKNSIK